MDKIDFEGFFLKNKFLLITGFIIVALIIGGVFGFNYYNYKMAGNADKLLWKGVRLYMSFNGKNQKVIVRSVSYLKRLKNKYNGTQAYNISNFYLGLDYMRVGKLKRALSYLREYAKIYPKPDSNNLTYLAYSNMAAIAMLQKKYNDAISYFSDMAKIDNIKLQEYALFEEASLYTQIKEPERAVAIYKTMLTNDAVTKDRGLIENLIQLNLSSGQTK